MPHLVLPSVKYKKSFLKGLNEVLQEKQQGKFVVGFLPEESYAEISDHFSEFVRKLRNHSLGKDLPKGWLPATRYWLVKDTEYLGEADIRHNLNKTLNREGGHIGYQIRPSKKNQGYGSLILKLALKKARKLGIKRALLICNKENIASRKIIENNGGIFENEVQLTNGTSKLRFWIPT